MSGFANLDPALAINPDAARVRRFLALDASEPVVFVNLHRYRERAQYPEGYAGLDPHVSGREAYHRYVREVERRFLPQVGARFLIVAPVDLTLIGAGDWHGAVIASYPSRKAALELPALPGYAEIAVHRLAGLEAALTVALGGAALDRLRDAR